MKRMMILAAALLYAVPAVFGITGEEIIREADRNQVFKSAEAEGEIRVSDRFGEKTSTFRSWSMGAEEALIEFTSAAEKGQKILRTADEIYLYYPDAEEIIRMQGAALRQGMLGSDISYEDMTGGKDRLSDYDVELQGNDTVNGRECWVVLMTAKTRTVPYPVSKLWIGKQDYVTWKAEYSTKSGRLLKVSEVLETREIAGRVLPVRTSIEDKMKQDSRTLMILNELKVDIAIDPYMFSLDELSW